MQERLAAVLETSGELQRHRDELIRWMREALQEMRARRERLLAEHGPTALLPAPTPAERLVEKFRLTPRELEVALLLSDGASNTVIANTLQISEHTARHHTRHVLVKLGLHSRARAAALIARELGATAPPIR
jgi:DNA-binding CsgD family transcriptional regulator